MIANRSYDTDGLDNPTQGWLQRRVRMRARPEWGTGRVMRWYPAGAGLPPRLRVMFERQKAPQVVSVHDIEIEG